MTTFTRKISRTLASGRINPVELTDRAINAHDPEAYGAHKHRFHEGLFFYARLLGRPLVMAMLSHAYKNAGYEPVGFGYYTTALRRDEDILKIYEFTTRVSEHRRVLLVDKLRERSGHVISYLGERAVPTSIQVEPHPITGESCVTIHQPFIEGKPLTKRPYSASLNDRQRSDMIDILDGAVRMLDETGHLLDVNGHNLIATDNHVFVVDTVPMGQVDVKMRPKTMKILQEEQRFLSSHLKIHQ